MSNRSAPEYYEKRRSDQAIFRLVHALLWTVIFALRIEKGRNNVLYLVMAILCAVSGFVDAWIYYRYHLLVDDQGVLLCNGFSTRRIGWTEITRVEVRRGRFLSNDTVTLHSASASGKPLLLALEDELESVVRRYAPGPIEEIT